MIATSNSFYAQTMGKEDRMHDLCDVRKLVMDLRRFEEDLKRTTDLSLNEALCLCQAHQGKDDPGTLATELELSPSRLSRILDSLEKRAFIVRSICADDRRTVDIQLTPEGIAMVRQLHCTEIPIPEHLEKAIESLHASMQTGV
jgi:DNA-binding MarR family transcriptional regulator